MARGRQLPSLRLRHRVHRGGADRDSADELHPPRRHREREHVDRRREGVRKYGQQRGHWKDSRECTVRLARVSVSPAAVILELCIPIP